MHNEAQRRLSILYPCTNNGRKMIKSNQYKFIQQKRGKEIKIKTCKRKNKNLDWKNEFNNTKRK